VNHYTAASFWRAYRALPAEVRAAADKSFALLLTDPRHPSLRLKRIGRLWSARVTLDYRAVARPDGEDLVWFWIGSHADYDRLLRG
jgi:hypothetical protein